MFALASGVVGILLGAGLTYLYFRDTHRDLLSVRSDYEIERDRAIAMEHSAFVYYQRVKELLSKQRHDLRDASGKFIKRG